MMIALALILAFAGFASLSVAQTWRATGLGVVLLVASLGACLFVWDGPQGLVAWGGVLSVSGLALVLGLPTARRFGGKKP